MDLYRAMSVFAAVIDQGGFAAAGRASGLSKPMVSKTISALEERLGVRLMQRTTRRLSLTEDGRRYLEHCRSVLDEVARVEGALGEKAAMPRGVLKVNAPVSFGQRYIAPLVGAFMAAYPDLKLELALTDRYVDIVEEGFDAAVRIGGDPASTLVARPLCRMRQGVYASASYLEQRGRPQSISDLKDHRCLVYVQGGRARPWLLAGKRGAPRGHLVSNNGDILRTAAAQGAGLVSLPDFFVKDDLSSGRLVLVEQEPEEDSISVRVVYPERKYLPLKVRVFIDYMVTALNHM